MYLPSGVHSGESKDSCRSCVTCTVTGKGPDGYRDALQYLAVQRA